ncbi:MAG: hypothetical protein M5R36_12655 [Deltaproteobacteria bacterium]|nr:hypothetical protein [Deltaproteobacteria bacterium]
MLKKTLTVAFVLVILFAFGVFVACGEVDPANAPAGSTITFVGFDEGGVLALTFAGVDEYGVTTNCYEVFVGLMVDYCTIGEADGSTDAATLTAAENLCEAGQWVVWEDKTIGGGSTKTYGDLARDALRDVGACGYYELIVGALVSRGTSEAGGTTTTQSNVDPLNDVEVRWVVSPGAELYELADDPNTILPLANPFLSRTDDRGLCEVKVRVPQPVIPGTQSDYLITADIGVDQAQYQIQMIAEDVSATDTTTDTTE